MNKINIINNNQKKINKNINMNKINIINNKQNNLNKNMIIINNLKSSLN